jgi:hypothetical protein
MDEYKFKVFESLSYWSNCSHYRYLFACFLDNVSHIKRPALYNIETDSMEHFVQVLDPETGQVHKNDEGLL